MTQHGPFTRETVRTDVAEVLGRPAAELGDDDNLLAAGLDSVRLMTLSARWRERGARIPFVELAKTPTVRQWSALLAAEMPTPR
ncbi:phosphopantetheine-binding protein [Streptomyces gamaensis]|uniref:Phosphopantetheine-binding protein n=1 Tax=Streptomyces gamaensis TaxID=1763542 RepID=A0ABW0Z7D8_9ACTN